MVDCLPYVRIASANNNITAVVVITTIVVVVVAVAIRARMVNSNNIRR